MSEEQPHITVIDQGPYRVWGGVKLTRRWPTLSEYGEPIDWEPVDDAEADIDAPAVYDLCRCGMSKTKPFCDGSERDVAFDGTLRAPSPTGGTGRQAFPGTGVVLTDEPRLCSHAGFCENRFTSVWDMVERTADPEIQEKFKRMVSMCPSGRLQFAVEPGGEPVEREFEPSIATIPDGPLWVRGAIPIEGPDGTSYEARNRMTLCRCGRSGNKPFCDGTHAEVGFEAPA